MKEWSEPRINVIFELSTLENPHIDHLFNLSRSFNFLNFFFRVGGTICA